MEFHVGRLIDHVQLVVADLGASKRFYRAVLASLGRELTFEMEHAFASDELYVCDAELVGPELAAMQRRTHLAFQARDRDAVDRFHRAALEVGARDNGAPGERPYHPGYYAAFVVDPDGNNIEAVHHGPSRRSAESIVITAG
jgi:catechol 2,3-dioxygenase-like lactoylglutathione lyase family enzyme